jgi:hypothetical protein
MERPKRTIWFAQIYTIVHLISLLKSSRRMKKENFTVSTILIAYEEVGFERQVRRMWLQRDHPVREMTPEAWDQIEIKQAAERIRQRMGADKIDALNAKLSQKKEEASVLNHENRTSVPEIECLSCREKGYISYEEPLSNLLFCSNCGNYMQTIAVDDMEDEPATKSADALKYGIRINEEDWDDCWKIEKDYPVDAFCSCEHQRMQHQCNVAGETYCCETGCECLKFEEASTLPVCNCGHGMYYHVNEIGTRTPCQAPSCKCRHYGTENHVQTNLGEK